MWCFKDKKVLMEVLVYILNRMCDVYFDVLEEWDVECDSVCKVYYLVKIDVMEWQWLGVILWDKIWDNCECVVFFLQQKVDIVYNVGYISEVINVLSQVLKIK